MKHPITLSVCMQVLQSVFSPLGVPVSPPAACALDRVVEATNGAAVYPGQTVIEIRLSDGDGFAGGDFRLEYDPTILSMDEVRTATMTGSFLLAYDFPEVGTLAASLAHVEGLIAPGEAVILLVTLSPKLEAGVGTVTPICFHLARWYDENSVRYRLLADNALFRVGSELPSQAPLVLGLGSDSGFPNGTVRIPLSVSMGAGIGEVSGEVHFNPAGLFFESFLPTPRISGWSVALGQASGTVSFVLCGDEEIRGIEAAQLGWLNFTIPPSCGIGSRLVLNLQDAEVRSSGGCPFLVSAEGGQVLIGHPPSTVENFFLYDQDRRR
ncbi:MAG: hypothetical protein HUU16_05115 [Candidatus Omnitrophica bacterium]|nr:hypothetical protein [bacterium]NUN95532.1 hypothetical protein [Candidatus Omnitrophota bacterium]